MKQTFNISQNKKNRNFWPIYLRLKLFISNNQFYFQNINTYKLSLITKIQERNLETILLSGTEAFTRIIKIQGNEFDAFYRSAVKNVSCL